jgi:sugar phosphate isomerase/epimerase
MKVLSGRLRAALALALSAALVGAVAVAPTAAGDATAAKAPQDKELNRGIPINQISIQLWNFAAYVGFGSDPATQERAEEVLRRLSEMGYRNVEPFTFNGFSAQEYKALLDKYDLKAPSRHGPTGEAGWDQHLADAKELKQKRVGSGGFAEPGIGSYEDTVATAETMTRLGRRSVQNGTGRMFGHNHQGEFRTMHEDPSTGELKTAWQIMVENSDPRFVEFQLDLLWSTDGGADPVELLNTYGDRIKTLHVKDGINVADPANATPVPMGDGEMVFEPILRAAWGKVKYYIYEQDPPFGDPTFDPFASAQKGFDYLSSVRF